MHDWIRYNNNLLKNKDNEYSKEKKEIYDLFNIDNKLEFKTFIKPNKLDFIQFFKLLELKNIEEYYNFLFDNYAKDNNEISNDKDFRGFTYLGVAAKIILCDKIINQKAYINNSTIFEELLDLDSFKYVVQNNNENVWYRGQSNYEWGMLPSFYRNINFKGNLLTVDYNYLINDYTKKDILDRYSKIFKNNDIDYNFLAFMQHSVSYSPLIDFTDNIIVATSFAVGNTNDFNNYNEKDSSIYALSVNNINFYVKDHSNLEEIDRTIKEFEIHICKKYPIGAKIGKHTIKSFDDIIDALTPDFLLIDIPTNDRMKYQSGKFILFYNCLIINNKILYALNKNLHMKKYRIKCRSKIRHGNPYNFHDYLVNNYPQFKCSYMLNPYNWFED